MVTLSNRTAEAIGIYASQLIDHNINKVFVCVSLIHFERQLAASKD